MNVQPITAPDPGMEPGLSAEEERLLYAFERAWRDASESPIEKYWRDSCAPGSPGLLEELVRVDMEFRAARAIPFALSLYLSLFPELASSSGALSRIEAEQKRLESVSAASRTAPFPQVGSTFLGFELIGELGRGAFGCVFLARQADLAKRLVALKVTRGHSVEAQQLAQLQHTNIVPVFSVHQSGDLHAICMPFLGVATLADLISDSALQGFDHRSVQQFVSTVADRKWHTIPSLAAQETGPVVMETGAGGQGTIPSRSVKKYSALSGIDRDHAFAWLWLQLATGLKFAHDRGIVHGDIKPANVLISEDGNPLLLDFNLSTSRRSKASAGGIVGGTLPYMDEAQIQAVEKGTTIEESSDCFSLGVVFFQLFSGKLPYPVYAGSFEECAGRMIEDRRKGAAPIAQHVPDIHPDIASIIDQSLASDREKRYSGAAALITDLQRFLNHLPLVHAPNRSWKVRVSNWRKRHPKLASATSIGVLAGLIVVALTWILMAARQRVELLESQEQIRNWSVQLEKASDPLSLVDSPRTILDRQSAALLDLLENPPPAVVRLIDGRNGGDESGRATAREIVEATAGAWLALSNATLARLQFVRSATDRENLIETIRKQHGRAIRISPGLESSAGFLLQRSRLESAVGDHLQAQRTREEAAIRPVVDRNDLILVAHERLLEGDWNGAVALLEKTTAGDGDDFEAWLMLGNAHEIAGNFADAEACFSICLSLDPDAATALYHRAQVRFAQGDVEESWADYTRAIELDPAEPVYYANRALIEMGRENWESAEADLSMAIDLSGFETRLWYLRSQVREAVGNHEGASDDLSRFLETPPADQESRLVRGSLWMQQGERERALADFRAVLDSDPDNLIAWNNTAAALADAPDGLKNAIHAMSEVIRIDPENATALATRGVLYARAGDRSAALNDAGAALELDPSPDTRYRVAGIYARFADTNVGDKQQAVALVAMAALEEPGMVLGYLDKDPDIEPVLSEPEMKELRRTLESLRTLTVSPDSPESRNEHE